MEGDFVNAWSNLWTLHRLRYNGRQPQDASSDLMPRSAAPANSTTASFPLETLVIDDERDIADTIQEALREEGHRVTLAYDGGTALRLLKSRLFDLVISDIRLPKVDGMALFDFICREAPGTSVILMSAYGTVPEAVSAVRGHAVHYLAKPFELEELLSTARSVAGQRLVSAAAIAKNDTTPHAIIGESPQITLIKQRIAAIASSEVSVLIHGESGTGKEVVARTIHQLSERRNGPFVAVNCAAFPETLFEAELFGHERGAFTGAVHRREGRFEAARGGTLFLDEVTEMTYASQAKLLRVLQEGVFSPLGSDRTIAADVRILSATNAELRGCISNGRFREDLFYRLKVLEVRLPPLRARRGDVPLLAGHFLAKHCRSSKVPAISNSAWAVLSQYQFPGNVRELEHAIQHALVMSHGGTIDLVHLPDEIRGAFAEKDARGDTKSLSDAVSEFERNYVLQILDQVEWNKSKAAELLQISRKNLWEKLKRYGIEERHHRLDGDGEDPASTPHD